MMTGLSTRSNWSTPNPAIAERFAEVRGEVMWLLSSRTSQRQQGRCNRIGRLKTLQGTR